MPTTFSATVDAYSRYCGCIAAGHPKCPEVGEACFGARADSTSRAVVAKQTPFAAESCRVSAPTSSDPLQRRVSAELLLVPYPASGSPRRLIAHSALSFAAGWDLPGLRQRFKVPQASRRVFALIMNMAWSTRACSRAICRTQASSWFFSSLLPSISVSSVTLALRSNVSWRPSLLDRRTCAINCTLNFMRFLSNLVLWPRCAIRPLTWAKVG